MSSSHNKNSILKTFYIELVGCNDLYLAFYLPLGNHKYWCERCQVVRQIKKIRVASQMDITKVVEHLGGISSNENDLLLLEESIKPAVVERTGEYQRGDYTNG